MGIIIDLIIVAIFIVCIGIGYFKGLTGSLLKIVSFVLALVIAFVLFKPVANFIVDHTNWDENLEQAIKEMLIKENEPAEKEQTQEEQSMPDVITNYINDAVEKAGTEAKNVIVESTAREVAVTIINTGVLISLFLISRIILLLVKGLAELLTKLPVIKQFDKIGGILYGLIEALVISYVILAIVSFVSPMLAGTPVVKGIQESYVGSMMYNNNLLLKIIF